jgi:hypothetical protein
MRVTLATINRKVIIQIKRGCRKQQFTLRKWEEWRKEMMNKCGRRKKGAQNEEITNSNLRCMPKENGLSYGPDIAPAHSNTMSLAVLNEVACGG